MLRQINNGYTEKDSKNFADYWQKCFIKSFTA